MAVGSETSAVERLEEIDVERAVAYTPQPGDIVVIEFADRLTMDEVARLRAEVERVFGPDLVVALLSGCRFAGVLHPPAGAPA